MNWVTLKKFSVLSGYTEKALHHKIERGIWTKDIMWRKAPDGRLFININKFEDWIIKGAA